MSFSFTANIIPWNDEFYGKQENNFIIKNIHFFSKFSHFILLISDFITFSGEYMALNVVPSNYD